MGNKQDKRVLDILHFTESLDDTRIIRTIRILWCSCAPTLDSIGVYYAKSRAKSTKKRNPSTMRSFCSSTYFNGMNPWLNHSLHHFLVWFTRNEYPSFIHKVDMCYSDTFSLVTHFSSDLKHTIVRWLTNPYCAHSHLPHNVQSSFEHFMHLSKPTFSWSFSCHIHPCNLVDCWT